MESGWLLYDEGIGLVPLACPLAIPSRGGVHLRLVETHKPLIMLIETHNITLIMLVETHKPLIMFAETYSSGLC